MKLRLISILLMCSPPVLADDVASAKAAFGEFSRLQQANDRKILDLISADCSGRLIQSDGEIEIASDIPKGHFMKIVEAAIL